MRDEAGTSNNETINFMNESAQLNLQNIKRGAENKHRVQTSSIKNVVPKQDKNQNLDKLGNTLTKTIQSVSNALNQLKQNDKKAAKSKPTAANNQQNNLRIDKNQIINFQKMQPEKRYSRSKENSHINTVIQTIDKEQEKQFREEFSPACKHMPANDPKEHSNSRNRAKSMMYSKIVPIGKFQPDENDSGSMNMFSFQVQMKNREQLLNSLENIKGISNNATQKLGNEIRQINKKKNGFNNTQKQKLSRPATSLMNKQGLKAKPGEVNGPSCLMSDKDQLHNEMYYNIHEDDQIITNLNFNTGDHEVTTFNAKASDKDASESLSQGYNPENDIELFHQLQLLNDLDESQLDEEQLVQYNDLMNIKKNLERNIDAHQLLGQTMTRQGDRTNMIDEYQRTKSKTAINSLGNTLGNAIFFTNEFGGQ